MAYNRSTRGLVASIASAFLLLCQTTALVGAQALTSAPAAGTTSMAPCHDSAPPSGNPDEHAQRHDCPSQYASAGWAKIDAPQAPYVPAMGVALRMLPGPAGADWLAMAPPARAGPPPLTILHCCLRN